MVPWVRTVTGGGREEQMQEQDEVLLASATVRDLDCPIAVASLRTEASSLTSIVCCDAVSAPCLLPRWQPNVMVWRQLGCGL
jgi:chaperone required for assembly of F1-ATPase